MDLNRLKLSFVLISVIVFFSHVSASVNFNHCENSKRITSSSYKVPVDFSGSRTHSGNIIYTWSPEDDPTAKLEKIEYTHESQIGGSEGISLYTILFDYNTIGRPNKLTIKESYKGIEESQEINLSYSPTGAVISKANSTYQERSDNGAMVNLKYNVNLRTTGKKIQSAQLNADSLGEGSVISTTIDFKGFQYEDGKIKSFTTDRSKLPFPVNVNSKIRFTYLGCKNNAIEEAYGGSRSGAKLQRVFSQNKQLVTIDYPDFFGQGNTNRMTFHAEHSNKPCNESDKLAQEAINTVFLIASPSPLPWSGIEGDVLPAYVSICQ